MVIQHNISALNAHKNLGINNSASAKNLEKLSSGYRINRAGDDAAGLAISEKMRGQIRGLTMAEQNALGGISLIQTAEGGLNETHMVLQRMRELAVQSANGTYGNAVDRYNLNLEVEALKYELDRIASSTHYNGINLLDGSMGGKQIQEGKKGYTAEDLLEKIAGLSANAVVSVSASMASRLSGVRGVLTLERGGDMALISAALLAAGRTYLGQSEGGSLLFTDPDGNQVASMDFTEATDASFANTCVTVVFRFDTEAIPAGVLSEDGVVVAGDSARLIFQLGANGSADQQAGLRLYSVSTGFIGDGADKIAGINVSTRQQANEALAIIDAAVNLVSDARAELGALHRRLEHTVNNLSVARENLTAAESSIRDVDLAREMMGFAKNRILSEASQAMLSQSTNLLSQTVVGVLASGPGLGAGGGTGGGASASVSASARESASGSDTGASSPVQTAAADA